MFIHLIASQIAEVLYGQLGLKVNLKTELFHLSEREEKEKLLKSIRKSSSIDEYFGSIQKDNEEGEKEGKSIIETPQDKLDKILKELKNVKKSKLGDCLVKGNSAQKEILKEVSNPSVEQILDKPENKKKINQIFKKFNFDLVKVQPFEILIVLLKNEIATNEFRSFCLGKTIITISDADLIVRLLCQTGFNEQELLEKLSQNVHMKNIVDIFLDEKLNCDKPGYYNLACTQTKHLSEMPDVLEQTRLRILNERSASYSVALNHLVNEIHAVCIKQEKTNNKNYDVNSVVNFLRSKGIRHEVCIKIRNLFDRRNSNSVSHPGSDKSLAWEVTKEEYLDYYEHVGQCLDFLP